MTDPYEILGLSSDSDDTTIRKRYLELVKQHPPERAPEKFRAIRAAYDQLRDVTTRVRSRLFEPRSTQDIDTLIEEVACQTPRRRLSLKSLLVMTRRS
jgi:DnaJ-class molecular chaperone